jgi:hypothetical protein
MINPLIAEANALLKNMGLPYAFCGGYAIELFLGCTVRRHGDIDISAFWADRDDIIRHFHSLGWQVYEMCGGGVAHSITDTQRQLKLKRNIFCFADGCDLVHLTPTDEPDMAWLDFDHKGQSKLNFIEFLFNDKYDDEFLYARNAEIKLPMSKAVLYSEDIPYLAPELVLLYKSTDTEREGYQLDYDSAITEMNAEQLTWFNNALKTMNPQGHKWLRTEAAK